MIIWKLRYRLLVTFLRFYTAGKWLDEEKDSDYFGKRFSVTIYVRSTAFSLWFNEWLNVRVNSRSLIKDIARSLLEISA